MHYCFGLEGIQDADIGIGVEHFVIVILSVNKFQFEELQLLPSLLQLFFTLL
jgi:hypothetical protein